MRDDGVGYGDYVEQITYLIFLKMADERKSGLLGSIFCNRHNKKPALTGKEIANLLGVTPRAANGLIDQFIELGILEEVTGFQRNRLFFFRKYIQLFS